MQGIPEQSRFNNARSLSLTPRFSGVCARTVGKNCFNSFFVKPCARSLAFHWIILFLLAHATAALGFTFNVPLISLTNHNTSAYSNYTFVNFGANFGPTSAVDTVGGYINIDSNKMDMSLNPVTPGHVSRMDVHALLPGHPNLRWFAHATPWFGAASHIN